MKLKPNHINILRRLSGDRDAPFLFGEAFELAELRAEGLIEMRPIGGCDYVTDAGREALKKV